jgi:excisionase family DNA binding protein
MKLKLSNSLEKENEMIFENRIASEWMSTSDAARYLGTTPNAIRIMVCRGKVKFFKFGRLLRFKARDLNLMLQKGA